MSQKEHPPWKQPTGGADKGLFVYNSLTSTKVPFVPEKGNTINWYTCGPTVYASSHLGHARAYVTFDIVRRILEDYFGYNVNLVMNITDVDDKIILRARQNYLIADYTANATSAEQVAQDASVAFTEVHTRFAAKIEKLELAVKEGSSQHQKTSEELLSHEKQKHKLVVEAEKKFKSIPHTADNVSTLIQAASSVLADWLDKQKGHLVTDHGIFREHAKRFEDEFMEDMRSLNVKDPHALTRVSEYIDHIVAYVETIIKNGFAYEVDGSVYFDVASFSKTHNYAKLRPWNVGNADLLEDGEGALGSSGAGSKRSAVDFALWKASKAGEPEWDSPWGKGRPGWHIECSAMACDIIGDVLDIHSGGQDLCFPHHDNEMAQAEAFYDHQQWVNYFMHAGHLDIAGLKMSKSLKNFLTIREILEKYSWRRVRLAFLMQRWNSRMNYSDAAIEAAGEKERQLKEFFLNVRSARRILGNVGETAQLWTDADKRLNQVIIECQEKVDEALKDNLDYPGAFTHLMTLVTETNKYLHGIFTSPPEPVKLLLLEKSADFVKRMLMVFGVDETVDKQNQEDVEDHLAPILDALANFRHDVRHAAIKKDTDKVSAIAGTPLTIAGVSSSFQLTDDSNVSAEVAEKQNELLSVLSSFVAELTQSLASGVDVKQVLALCDKLRDDQLVELGVRLEDGHERTVWKLEDREVLLKELEEKRQAERRKQLKKLDTQLKSKEKDLSMWQSRKLTPSQVFRSRTTEYSQFDDNGMPTHDAAGEEMKKSKKKKIDKEWKRIEKAHQLFIKQKDTTPDFLEKLEEDVQSLRLAMQ